MTAPPAAVALVTYRSLPDLDGDDRPLVGALASRGVRARPVVWDDATVDWSRFACAVLRSTWDYHLRTDEFLAWLERASRATRVVNPPHVVRWSAHKKYLLDLAARGVPVVPTRLLARGSRVPDDVALDDSVFVKPAVSVGAEGAVSGERAAEVMASLLARGDVLVQPRVESLAREGERSFVFFAEAFSHAVARRPGVQGRDYGRPATPTADELALAQRALAAAHDATAESAPFVYARVDVARGARGEPLVTELELVEPTLFLAHGANAPATFAAAVHARVT